MSPGRFWPLALISEHRVSQSADDFSERSREREQRSLEEEQEDASPRAAKKCRCRFLASKGPVCEMLPDVFFFFVFFDKCKFDQAS